jgi:hypothetical protein
MIRLTVFAVMFGIGTASLATVSFIDPASAATRHSTQYGNPDEGPYPASRSCEGTTCFRSGHQKIQHPRHQRPRHK